MNKIQQLVIVLDIKQKDLAWFLGKREESVSKWCSGVTKPDKWAQMILDKMDILYNEAPIDFKNRIHMIIDKYSSVNFVIPPGMSLIIDFDDALGKIAELCRDPRIV